MISMQLFEFERYRSFLKGKKNKNFIFVYIKFLPSLEKIEKQISV